jgi:replication-associated recombination protein RarA
VDAPKLLLDDGLVAGDDGRQDAVLLDAAGMPLAARLRPRDLSEFVGQMQAVGEGRPLRRMLDRGHLSSLVLWGPPGVGKTSLARVIAGTVDASWVELSAVTAGVKDVRRALEEGRARLEQRGRRTILFIDEIHRFNKAQQDALLPGVEAGWVTLVGATTENPFFELNAPLLSRCQLVRLEPLTAPDIRVLLERAVSTGSRPRRSRHPHDEALSSISLPSRTETHGQRCRHSRSPRQLRRARSDRARSSTSDDRCGTGRTGCRVGRRGAPAFPLRPRL